MVGLMRVCGLGLQARQSGRFRGCTTSTCWSAGRSGPRRARSSAPRTPASPPPSTPPAATRSRARTTSPPCRPRP
eukprot:2837773-Rhodomonas_salina.6